MQTVFENCIANKGIYFFSNRFEEEEENKNLLVWYFWYSLSWQCFSSWKHLRMNSTLL